MQSHQTWLWYVLGLSFGLALLSKYTAILLAPCLLLYLVLTDERRWLKTFYHISRCLLGFFALFLLYIGTAATTGFHSHSSWTAALAAKATRWNDSRNMSPGNSCRGPGRSILGMYAAISIVLRKNKGHVSTPHGPADHIFFGISSLRKLAGPNWPVFAYFTLSILVTKYFLDSTSRIKRSLWFTALFACLFISTIATLHAKFSIIPVARFSRELAVADPTTGSTAGESLRLNLRNLPAWHLPLPISPNQCRNHLLHE